MNHARNTPKIGLALGSGASRGWSHVGVLKALLKAGIEPDVVCGTSVGAMVGASYVAGNLDALENWVLASTRGDVLSFFSLRLANTAFVDIERFNWFLHSFVAPADVRVEYLHKPYAAVCTDLENGREVWMREGRLSEAVRASMAMPGLFPAVHHEQRWLVDGGLVNPVPVTPCRALGADVVIGVNLNADILSRRNLRKPEPPPPDDNGVLGQLKKQAREYSAALFANDDDEHKAPSVFFTVSKSINIFQDQITRSRLQIDPADIVIAPRVGDIGMLDFQRAADAIKEGIACVETALDDIRKLCEPHKES